MRVYTSADYPTAPQPYDRFVDDRGVVFAWLQHPQDPHRYGWTRLQLASPARTVYRVKHDPVDLAYVAAVAVVGLPVMALLSLAVWLAFWLL